MVGWFTTQMHGMHLGSRNPLKAGRRTREPSITYLAMIDLGRREHHASLRMHMVSITFFTHTMYPPWPGSAERALLY